MTDEFYYRAFANLNIQVGICSNFKANIYDEEYFSGQGTKLHSLLSNFHRLKEVTFSLSNDTNFYLIDMKSCPLNVDICTKNVYLTGDIQELEGRPKDKRKAIFGNMGFFSKLMIRALEHKGTYSFHSVSFICPKNNTLYLVLGGTGAGKSVVLLSALEKGCKLFGSELTHFSIVDSKVLFHKGSLAVNCRVGNLVEDFPSFAKRFKIYNLPTSSIWDCYRSVDMSELQAEQDILEDPDIILILPRIEAQRRVPTISKVDHHKLKGYLFDNICEKISPPSIIGERYLLPALDSFELQTSRMEAIIKFCDRARVTASYQVLAAPDNCLEGIMP
jgi:hypothetical protein